MAVYTVPDRKKLKAKNHDLETLLKTLGVEAAAEGLGELLSRAQRRGDDVYVWVSPYSVEILGPPMVFGGTDFETECDYYYDSVDSI